MIHYHGTPMTPDSAAVAILTGRHGLVSFVRQDQIELVAEVCQSFILDNGAFTHWKQGKGKIDCDKYYSWVEDWQGHPGFDWALIPDVIDGSEQENDALVENWPFKRALGVPVWHVHESLERLLQLAMDFPRVAIGSSGIYAKVGTPAWWERMSEALSNVCDGDGIPHVKLHGLRMLDPKVFTRLPLSSADSSNVARNIGIDKRWVRSAYPPPTKGARGIVIASRIEAFQSAGRWESA